MFFSVFSRKRRDFFSLRKIFRKWTGNRIGNTACTDNGIFPAENASGSAFVLSLGDNFSVKNELFYSNGIILDTSTAGTFCET